MAYSVKEVALSYPLTRPFPFSRRLWLLLFACGITLVTLFTFLAVATNGFEYRPKYTTDLSSEEGRPHWFQNKLFSWVNDMETVCQDTLLLAGGRYMTQNHGYLYNLNRLWRDINGTITEVPQVGYHNATLDGCNVAQIAIHLGRQDDSRRSGVYWTWGNTRATAVVTCSIKTSPGGEIVKADFGVELPPVGDDDRPREVRSPCSSQDVALQRGCRITTAWYHQIPRAMSYAVPDANLEDAWASGTIRLLRNETVSDYLSPDFFTTHTKQYTRSGHIRHMEGSMSTWASDLMQINITVDAFGKSLWSLLAADFNVNNTSNPLHSRPGVIYLKNITDTTALNASRQCDDLDVCGAGTLGWGDPSIDADFGSSKPATLFTQYLCSVPQQKDGFSIFYAVLLADIVFLHACWSIWATVSSCWLNSKDHTANYCAGCIAQSSALDKDVMSTTDTSPHKTNSSNSIASLFRAQSVDALSLQRMAPADHRLGSDVGQHEMPLLGLNNR